MENSNVGQRQPPNNINEMSCSSNMIFTQNEADSKGSWTNYRPRGSLARALHDKVVQDQYLRKLDKNEWYQCDLSSVSPALRLKFVQLGPDEETLKFIEESEKKSDWIFTQIWHMLVKLVLGWFVTHTSINGIPKDLEKRKLWLVLLRTSQNSKIPSCALITFIWRMTKANGAKYIRKGANPRRCKGLLFFDDLSNRWLQRGSMFVVSQPQLLQLLKINNFEKYESLLDLGAGDGKVTDHFVSLFEKVYVTEISPAMRSILQKKGFSVLDIENWYLDRKFDIISCLNLIDRCDRPQDLLEQIRSSIKPDGLVLLAVVLPFAAYVESGAQDHKPQQLLPIQGNSFEEQVQSIVNDILRPAKFELVSWSRVPYLCEGDLQQSYYWLDDAIFVLRPI